MVERTGSRATRRPLRRDAIIEAGIAIADADGIDALSMRRVGAALGVQAMSLYNHVANKQDLLDGMVAHLLAGMEAPGGADVPWREVARSVGRAYRQLGLDHPALFPHILARPFGSDESVAALEQYLAVFRHAGFPPAHTYLAFTLLTSFVEGFTLDEITRKDQRQRADPVGNPLHLAGPDRYPVVRDVFTAGRVADDEAFERCLGLVIGAIERLAP